VPRLRCGGGRCWLTLGWPLSEATSYSGHTRKLAARFIIRAGPLCVCVCVIWGRFWGDDANGVLAECWPNRLALAQVYWPARTAARSLLNGGAHCDGRARSHTTRAATVRPMCSSNEAPICLSVWRPQTDRPDVQGAHLARPNNMKISSFGRHAHAGPTKLVFPAGPLSLAAGRALTHWVVSTTFPQPACWPASRLASRPQTQTGAHTHTHREPLWGVLGGRFWLAELAAGGNYS